MNFAHACKYLTATLLVAIYLVMPAPIVASTVSMDKVMAQQQPSCLAAISIPCKPDPCHEDQGSGCCETTSCNCACHAPLASSLRLIYAPVIVDESFFERAWSLPQVYSQIFVPPQNIPATL